MVEGSIVAICLHGGEFITNADGSLSYTGGEAYAVDVYHNMLLEDFKSEVATSFGIDINAMSMKYFIPGNRRVLITVSNDKDLQRMVAYNKDNVPTEVYILNKVDNRATRSNVADSGTSIAATVAVGQNGKRKRPTPGGRATKSKMRLADSVMPHAASNVTANGAANARHNTATANENIDNRFLLKNTTFHVCTT